MRGKVLIFLASAILAGCGATTETGAEVEPRGGAKEPACVDTDGTTPALTACYGAIVRKSRARHEQLLTAAVKRNIDYPDLARAINTVDEKFKAYQQAECDAVAESYGRGTIRGMMRQICVIELTDQRALIIWRNWLQYANSTPPDYPKPESLLE